MIINMKGFRPEHKAIVVGFLYVSTVLGLLDDIGIDEIRKANEPKSRIDKFHVHQCQAQNEIDVHLTFT